MQIQRKTISIVCFTTTITDELVRFITDFQRRKSGKFVELIVILEGSKKPRVLPITSPTVRVISFKSTRGKKTRLQQVISSLLGSHVLVVDSHLISNTKDVLNFARNALRHNGAMYVAPRIQGDERGVGIRRIASLRREINASLDHLLDYTRTSLAFTDDCFLVDKSWAIAALQSSKLKTLAYCCNVHAAKTNAKVIYSKKTKITYSGNQTLLEFVTERMDSWYDRQQVVKQNLPFIATPQRLLRFMAFCRILTDPAGLALEQVLCWCLSMPYRYSLSINIKVDSVRSVPRFFLRLSD